MKIYVLDDSDLEKIDEILKKLVIKAGMDSYSDLKAIAQIILDSFDHEEY